MIPPISAQQRQANDRRGAVFMLVSGVCFTCATVLMRHLSSELPETVVMFYRHIFATLCFVPVLVSTRGRLIATRRIGAHIVRSLFGFVSFFGFVWSFNRMPLADATALAFTSPLWSMALSVVILHETLRPLRVIAAIVGFGGVLLVAKPSGILEWPVLVGLAAAMVTSGAMMMIKRLSATEPPDRIAFFFMLTGIFYSLPLAIPNWRWPEPMQYLWLAALGLIFSIGQVLLSRAYTVGQFSRMAPMDYCRMPLAILLGFLVFGELPDWSAVAGMAIIAAASLYTILGGRRRPAT